MTRTSASRFATAALVATLLGASGTAFAYGSVAPMGVSGIEAQAPVTSLNATTTVAVDAGPQTPPVRPAPRLRNWIAALRRHIDGAIEVALR